VDYAAVLQRLEVGVVLQDATTRILYANPAARRLLGLEVDGPLPLLTSLDPHWDAILPDGTPCPGPEHPVPVALREKRTVRDVVLGVKTRQRAERVWLQITAVPQLDAAGEVVDILVAFSDVSQRVGELSAADANYRAAINAMGEGIVVVDRAGHILTRNSTGQQILGVAPHEQWESRRRGRVFDETGRELTREEIPDRLALRDGRAYRNQVLQLLLPEGRRVWLRINADPIRLQPDGPISGVVATFADITQEREAVEALKEERSRLRLMSEAVPGVVFEHLERANGEDTFIYMGPGVLPLCGVSADEVMRDAKAFWSRVHPDDLTRVLTMRQRAFKEASMLDEELRVGSDASGWRWARVRLSTPRATPEGHQVMYGLLLDVTEQRLTAERLRAAERQEGLGLLAAGMAHNFNNVLSAIVPNLERLSADAPDSMKADLHDAWQAAQSASELVRQLTQLVRREAEPVHEPVDCLSLVADVISFCSHTFDRHIEVTSRVPNTHVLVRGRRSELYQVLLTLCLNARDALETTKAPKLHLALTRDGDHALLSVTDNGAGMTSQTMQHLGEPFFTTREPGRGTGLGVAAALGVMRALGGELRWTSKLDEGSCFTMRIPALPEEHPAPATPPPATPMAKPSPLAGRPLAGRRVLLIDDEQLVRRSLKRLLERLGAEVVEAGDGAAGLTQLWSRGDVDAVFVDLSMPEMKGDEVLATIRARTTTLPVFILSGFVPDPDALVGATGIITKPFTNDAVRDALLGALG
jgi:PAS domain S-box-containing protein